MNKRIQPMPTIIHATLLEIPIRNMNKVNMIKKPRESLMLAGKVLLVNIVCITLTIPKPIWWAIKYMNVSIVWRISLKVAFCTNKLFIWFGLHCQNFSRAGFPASATKFTAPRQGVVSGENRQVKTLPGVYPYRGERQTQYFHFKIKIQV